jgi:hypothetical protein
MTPEPAKRGRPPKSASASPATVIESTDDPIDPVPSFLPQVEEKPLPQPLAIEAPGDNEFHRGLYVMREGHHAGEQFALAIHEPDLYGKTHSLKNSIHFWQGTAEDFRNAFDPAK